LGRAVTSGSLAVSRVLRPFGFAPRRRRRFALTEMLWALGQQKQCLPL